MVINLWVKFGQKLRLQPWKNDEKSLHHILVKSKVIGFEKWS